MKIVFVGLGGVPFSKRAIDVRERAFAELFISLGYTVEIANRFSNVKNNEEKAPYEIYEPFKHVITTSKLGYLFYYVISLLWEPFHLLLSHKRSRIDVLFVNSGHFVDMLVYKIICLLTGARFLYQYCEDRASMAGTSLYHKANGYLIGQYAPQLWNGAVCISHYLENKCLEKKKDLKTILVYPICDFAAIEPLGRCPTLSDDYILFCGYLGYMEIIRFIIDSYHQSSLRSRYKLVMVLGGDKGTFSRMKSQHTDIHFLRDLPYDELIGLFRNAKALLIPLRNNIRDIARYPNKICEYSAASGLIVTTNNGEIPYTFHDGVNALVAKEYSISSYASKLNEVASIDNAAVIKQNCYETGKAHFSISSYREKMEEYISDLVSKK